LLVIVRISRSDCLDLFQCTPGQTNPVGLRLTTYSLNICPRYAYGPINIITNTEKVRDLMMY